MKRTIQVDYLARVEGEGALSLTWDGQELSEVALSIFEPPRFFEAFLVGRSCMEVADITARICGICPVAYQMSACRAIEDALGVELPAALHQLRRVLYCGEWIESHVLHMALLHTPDFFGVDDAMEVAKQHSAQIRAALAVKKAGNGIVGTLGGREIHPINVKPGGFWRLPRKSEVRSVIDSLAAQRAHMEDLLRWMGGFDFPDLHRPHTLVCLDNGVTYPFMEGRVISSEGLDVSVQEWPQHFAEQHVERSNALHATLHGGTYLTGPMARFNLCFDRLPESLKRLAVELGIEPPVTNPFRSLLVRGIEVLLAMDETISLLSGWKAPDVAAVPLEYRVGLGHGASEAPRGLLYHRYALDEDGRVTAATIVPPTSQNQRAMEADLRALGPQLRDLDQAEATRLAEQAIRNHDPCISCATHFLTLDRTHR